MPGGTFTLVGIGFNVTAGSFSLVGGASIAACLQTNNDGQYITAGPLGGPVFTLRVNTSTLSWVLVGTGGGTYTLATLPAGLKVLTAQVNYGGGGVGVTNFGGGSDSFVNANANANVQGAAIDQTVLSRAGGQVSPATPKVLVVTGDPTDLNNDGFGFQFNLTGSGVDFLLDVLNITGTYSVDNFTFTLSPLTQPVVPGTSVITVTSDPSDPNAMDLSQLSSVTITGDGGLNLTVSSFTTATPNLLVFTLPLFGGPTPQVITLDAVGNGTQFSGSVTLGILETIFFVNAPGIYFLDPTATFDTLYNPDGGTIQVPIPTPFFKTGYIGG